MKIPKSNIGFISLICWLLLLPHNIALGTRLLLKNNSDWRIEITVPIKKVIEPDDLYLFGSIPNSFNFRPYGRVWGWFGQETTINIQQLCHEKGISIPKISEKDDLLIIIGIDTLQRWIYTLEIQPADFTRAELGILPKTKNPWDAFPAVISHKNRNPRYILGLPEQYTAEDVKRTFRNLSLRWHPDKHPENKKLAKEITQILENARDQLLRQLGQ